MIDRSKDRSSSHEAVHMSRGMRSARHPSTSITDVPAPGGPIKTILGGGPDPAPMPTALFAVSNAEETEDEVDFSSWPILSCSCSRVQLVASSSED